MLRDIETLELLAGSLKRGWEPQLDLVVDTAFPRERLLKNLLATSPLFRPFTRQQKMDLIRRFDGHEVAPGTAPEEVHDAAVSPAPWSR